MEKEKPVSKRPFLHGLYWIVEVSGNPYISIAETDIALDFMLWGKNDVRFEVSTRRVNTVSDLVYKIENTEKNGDINIYCFPTAQDQMQFAVKHYGEI